MENTLKLLGYAVGIAGNDPGTSEGPIKLQAHPGKLSIPYEWQGIFAPASIDSQLAAVPIIHDVCKKLGLAVKKNIQSQTPFVVIGGDHSSAIGTWSGAADAFTAKGDFGLIWVDAHLDSHTPESSLTKNIHGMPLAILLGQGSKQLTDLFGFQPKLKPNNVCVIGARSYESSEAELLNSLGVKIFWMEDVIRLGLTNIFQQAIQYVNANTVAYGISIDLDAIDPSEAPAVSVPEPVGLSAKDLIKSLQSIPSNQFPCGIEIVEFNPALDLNNRTEELIWLLINALYKEI